MRKFVLIFISLTFLFSCNNETPKEKITTDIVTNPETIDSNNSEKTASIKFNHTDFNFGSVIAGEKVTHTYKFKNVGNADLVIVRADASCGCTVPSYTEKPVPPGGEGKVEVVFDSSNRQGMENKKVTIMANTQPSSTILTFSVEVINPNR